MLGEQGNTTIDLNSLHVVPTRGGSKLRQGELVELRELSSSKSTCNVRETFAYTELWAYEKTDRAHCPVGPGRPGRPSLLDALRQPSPNMLGLPSIINLNDRLTWLGKTNREETSSKSRPNTDLVHPVREQDAELPQCVEILMTVLPGVT